MTPETIALLSLVTINAVAVLTMLIRKLRRSSCTSKCMDFSVELDQQEPKPSI